MSTIRSTLQLFDAFSRPLQSVAQAADITNASMRRLQTTTSQNENMARSFTAAKQKIAAADDQIRQAIDQSTSAQNKFNRSLQEGQKQSDGLMGKIKGIAAAWVGFEAIKKLGELTFGGALEQKKMEDMFIARTGSQEVGTAMFDKFKAEALATGQDVEKSLQSTLSFFSSTQNVNQLTKLNNLAQRLNAFDSAGNGIEGAAFALKEALSGDIVSLAERFNMSKVDIRAFKIDQLGKTGDIEGFIKAFDQLLEKQKMGQAAFETMMKSPAKQVEVFKNNLKSAFANAGQSGIEALTPLISMLNEAFQDGKFQPFFDGLNLGLRLIGQGAQWAGELILNNMDIVKNVLIAVGIVLAALAIQWLITWVSAALPVLAIIAAIALVITILNKFGVSTSEIVGYVTGVFYGLFAFLWNQIALLWNPLVSFAEFLGNVFIDPVYAVKKLFYDLMKNSVDYFKSIINSVIDGANWLINKVNEVAGTKFKTFGTFESDWVEDLKPTTDKNVFDFDKYKMDFKDITGSAVEGFKAGTGAFDKASEALKEFDFKDWNKEADINKVKNVDSVGKINDKVDISSEDLKVMRELAEIKSIQNFIALTPTVHVETGDIHQEADVDDLIQKITDVMERDISNSVEGVYGVGGK